MEGASPPFHSRAKDCPNVPMRLATVAVSVAVAGVVVIVVARRRYLSQNDWKLPCTHCTSANVWSLACFSCSRSMQMYAFVPLSRPGPVFPSCCLLLQSTRHPPATGHG